MRSIFSAFAALLLLSTPALAGADASSSQIADETKHAFHAGQRVVQFWWLPVEYWVATARERKMTDEQISQVRTVFRNYTVLAAIDVEVKPDGFNALSIAEIVRRLDVAIAGGGSVEPLRQVDKVFAELIPDLSYVLSTSLGPLAGGLRLLPFANVDSNGDAIIYGSSESQIRAIYKIAGEEPFEMYWHAPLTAIAGKKRCPTGQLMQAHWKYCPWTGAKVD